MHPPNSSTDQPYVVCKSCWDKVKNVKTGARAWVNGELERMPPGLIDGYRDQIRRDGVDSDAYRAFEVIIHEQLDRCEANTLTKYNLMHCRHRCAQVPAGGACAAAVEADDARGTVRAQIRP